MDSSIANGQGALLCPIHVSVHLLQQLQGTSRGRGDNQDVVPWHLHSEKMLSGFDSFCTIRNSGLGRLLRPILRHGLGKSVDKTANVGGDFG